jgi:hypothetical protein
MNDELKSPSHPGARSIMPLRVARGRTSENYPLVAADSLSTLQHKTREPAGAATDRLTCRNSI